MGWHSDGVDLGLWGNDGIPYGINSRSWSDDYDDDDDDDDDDSSEEQEYSSSRRRYKTKRYSASEQQAYDLGYRAVYDDNAFGGRYFQKNGKIWIHNLSALKRSLGVDEDELEEMGYDIDAYYRYK